MQLVEEAHVQIHLLVQRAVEGSLRRVGETAFTLDVAAVRHGGCLHVARIAPRELVRPIALDAVDEADDATVFALVRIGAGPALLERLLRVHRLRVRRARSEGIDAEHDRGNEEDQPDRAAADDDWSTAGHSAATAILDLRRVQASIRIESHAARIVARRGPSETPVSRSADGDVPSAESPPREREE